MQKTAIVLLIAATLALAISAEVPYTHFAFNREWGSTVCGAQSCKTKDMDNYNGHNFNIHGLWSNGNAESGNQCQHWQECSSEKYIQSQLDEDLLDWMDANYVGMYNGSEGFRAHEYEKHGTCFNYGNEQVSNADKENYFFSTIRDLDAKYDLMEAFAKGGVVPDDNKQYTKAELVEALSVGFDKRDVSYELTCKYKKNDKSVQYLEVVQLCLSPDTFEMIQCPCPNSSQCSTKKNIIFPKTFKYNQSGQDEFEVKEIVEQKIEQVETQMNKFIKNMKKSALELIQ